MRASLQDTALPNLGNVLSVSSYTSDSQGGMTPVWGTAVAGVPYRLDFKTGHEPLTGGAVKPFTYWALTMPHDTAITSDNRFEDEDGVVYAISSVDTQKSYSLFMQLTVERV